MEMTLSPKELGTLAEHMIAVLAPRFDAVLKSTLTSTARNASLTKLTVKDVAEQLKLSEKTVLKYIVCGKLAAANFSTPDKPVWRIKQEAIDKFLDSRTS